MGRRRSGEMPRVAVVKPHNHVRVRIGGRAYWLGKSINGTVTKEQQREASKLWQQYLHGGIPDNQPLIETSADSQELNSKKLTVGQMMQQYLSYAEIYYRKPDGRTTSCVAEILTASRSLALWSDTPAAKFGSKALKAVRAAEINRGRPRVTVNRIAKTIRSAFKWAASEELVSASVWHALQTVAAIQKGRTKAPELPPITEVAEWVVKETIPFLSPVVAAMVMLQRWTGARPGEIVIIRPCDIDQQDKVWLYHPSHFKTDWQVNAERVIAIGPEGQQILKSFLNRPAESYCFSPRESEVWRSKVRRENRASSLTPSQAARRPKSDGKRRPRERYDTCSYRRAIERGVHAANKRRQKDGLELLPNWSPNQLRHLRAGEIEQTLGIEMAAAVLGHSKVETTAIYARRKQQLAIKAARMTG